MEIYLVGGFIRDRLLNLTSSDKDFVVVNGTKSMMKAQGFIEIGQFFPVFLDPHTKEEYALARKEKKVAQGHCGFDVDIENVTLEEDLSRRDLTINAIAEDTNGNLIDPFGGMRDIEKRILCHVSPAFVEDPLRVFRVARFFVKLFSFHFTIDENTLLLMKNMVSSGELKTISKERIYQELSKVLSYAHPIYFFIILKQCDVFSVWLNCKTLDFVEYLPDMSQLSPIEKLAVILLLSTNFNIEPALIKEDLNHFMCAFGIPRSWYKLVIIIVIYTPRVAQYFDFDDMQCLDFFNEIDLWRKPESFDTFLNCFHYFTKDIVAYRFFMDLSKSLRGILLHEYDLLGMTGQEIYQLKQGLRLDMIQQYFQNKIKSC